MSASLLLQLVKPELSLAEKYDYMYAFFKEMAGGEYVGFNNSVFLSERDTADRNFALAHFLRENGCFPPGEVNIQTILDCYFQSCSLEMTTESECVIAATLANGGVCPITNKRLVEETSVKKVMSLMLSCGLYNYSGDFAFKVGLPAKSGVSGALMLVVPNIMGICLWSPPLDEMGNTVRGVAFCEKLVRLYNLQARAETVLTMGSMLDPTWNKYEVASQVIIHLLLAASAGDEMALKSAFHQGVNMNVGDYDGRTALHLAATEGHIRCVRFLLHVCKVESDVTDRWGHTPLSEAIQFKHKTVTSIIRRYERLKQSHHGSSKPADRTRRRGSIPIIEVSGDPDTDERSRAERTTATAMGARDRRSSMGLALTMPFRGRVRSFSGTTELEPLHEETNKAGKGDKAGPQGSTSKNGHTHQNGSYDEPEMSTDDSSGEDNGIDYENQLNGLKLDQPEAQVPKDQGWSSGSRSSSFSSDMSVKGSGSESGSKDKAPENGDHVSHSEPKRPSSPKVSLAKKDDHQIVSTLVSRFEGKL